MAAYIARRLLFLPLVLFGITLVIFVLLMLIHPVERASLHVDRPVPRGQVEELIERYDLDAPVHVQFYRWTGRAVRGDLGWSRTAQRSVTGAIFHFLPATIELALWSLPVIAVGIWLGVVSAIHHNRAVDHLLRLGTIVGWSLPVFVFGLVALMVFHAKLQWFPAGRLSEWALQEVLSEDFAQYTRITTLDAMLNLRLDIFADALRHLVLPVISLAYLSWVLLLRVTRSAMLEVLGQDYVRTARAKGLRERTVIYTHALRNALIPVSTVGGLLVIGLLNGVVITETVFNYRGIGWLFVNAALQLDVVSVLGFALFNGFVVVLVNLAVDVSYAFLNPRVRPR